MTAMKKNFEKSIVKIVVFNETDIITTSTEGTDNELPLVPFA